MKLPNLSLAQKLSAIVLGACITMFLSTSFVADRQAIDAISRQSDANLESFAGQGQRGI